MRVQAGPRDSGHTLHREEGEISSQQQEGNACFQEGRFMDAIAAYSKAIDLIEAYASGATRRSGGVSWRAELLSNRSVARLKVSQIQEAVNDAKECIVYAPDWPKAYYRWHTLYPLCMHAFVCVGLPQGIPSVA